MDQVVASGKLVKTQEGMGVSSKLILETSGWNNKQYLKIGMPQQQ